MKLKFYSIIVITLAFSHLCYSQCTDVNLTTQAEVNTFRATGCTMLSGNLTISGAGISNLDSLLNLTSVNGNVYIATTSVTGLGGLEQLTTINGMITIADNAQLQDINALSNLKTVGEWNVSGQSITLENNPVLATIAGFAALTSLPGNLSIVNNDALVDLTGLNSIQNTRAITIQSNDALINIDALSLLTTLVGYVSIEENPALQNIDGLSSVTNIQSIGPVAALTIDNNASLTNIDGLASLKVFSGAENFLTIVNNPLLNEGCAIFPLLRDQLGCDFCGRSIVITNNGPKVTYDGIMINCVTDENRRCDLDFKLTSQALVDAFKSTYGCAVIEGSLTILGNDITNVDSLSTIESVYHLNIQETFVTNLDGLVNLKEINGGVNCACNPGLMVTDNVLIEDISGLSSLNRIDGNITIYRNPVLTNVDGLEGVGSVGGGVSIGDVSMLNSIAGLSSLAAVGTLDPEMPAVVISNTGLTDLHGLEDLDSIPGILNIEYNQKLRQLTGLNDLEFIGRTRLVPAGALMINSNPFLQDVDGLSKVNKIVSEVQISNNNSLKNLDGFQSLVQVGDDNAEVAMLIISDNDSLQHIDGLSQLARITATNEPWPRLIVSGNESLTRFCGLYKLLSENGVSGCTGSCSKIILENTTVEDIIVNGPCATVNQLAQPTNIAFTNVSHTSMTVSFTGSSTASEYLVVMRAYESSYPGSVPADGTKYSVGQLLGSSSIVVGRGSSTLFNIIYLNPNTEYWFAVYTYSSDGTYDYVNISPLQGAQRTTPPSAALTAWPNPFTDQVTIPFSTDSNDNVKVLIFDSVGATVSEVTNASFEAGKHQVVWNGTDYKGNSVPGGTYYYHVLKSSGATRGRLTK